MIFSLVTSSVSEQLLCACSWGDSSHAHVFAALVFRSVMLNVGQAAGVSFQIFVFALDN